MDFEGRKSIAHPIKTMVKKSKRSKKEKIPNKLFLFFTVKEIPSESKKSS